MVKCAVPEDIEATFAYAAGDQAGYEEDAEGGVEAAWRRCGKGNIYTSFTVLWLRIITYKRFICYKRVKSCISVCKLR